MMSLLAALLVLVCSTSAADNTKCQSGPSLCALHKFYYDPEANRCRIVSSQGDSCSILPPLSNNVFDSYNECVATCIVNGGTASTQPPTTRAPVILPGLCFLPVIRYASGHMLRNFYHYDHSQGSCNSFLYSGRDDQGNENRFSTLQECIDTCVHPKPPSPSPSLLPSFSSSTTLTTPTSTLTTPTNAPTSPATTDDRLTLSSAPPTRPRPSSSPVPDSVKAWPAVHSSGLHPLLLVAIVFGVMVSVFGVIALMVVWMIKTRRPLLIRDATMKQELPYSIKDELPQKGTLSQNQSHHNIVINHNNASFTHTLTASSSVI